MKVCGKLQANSPIFMRVQFREHLFVELHVETRNLKSEENRSGQVNEISLIK